MTMYALCMQKRTDDEQAIDSVRAAYNAHKTDSVLIEWICSEAWIDAHSTNVLNSGFRGSVWQGVICIGRNTCHGEIG